MQESLGFLPENAFLTHPTGQEIFSPMYSQGYYLDEWLICALNQVMFGTHVSDTYSFALWTWCKPEMQTASQK